MISLPSAFAVAFLPLSAAPPLLLGDFRDADAAGRGADHSDLSDCCRSRAGRHFAGLTLPLFASATATLLFRQFFLTIPNELVEAAKIDGAGPIRFLVKIAIPLSKTNIAALFVILFIYGWNQYLWPLLVTNDPSMTTIVIGIADDRQWRRSDRMAPDHGNGSARDPAAGRGRARDAALVRAGSDRNGEIACRL